MVSPTTAAAALAATRGTTATGVATGVAATTRRMALMRASCVGLPEPCRRQRIRSYSTTRQVLKSSNPAAIPLIHQQHNSNSSNGWSLQDLRRSLLQLEQQFFNSNSSSSSSNAATATTTTTTNASSSGSYDHQHQRHLSSLSAGAAALSDTSDSSGSSSSSALDAALEAHDDLFAIGGDDRNAMISPTELQELASHRPTPLRLADMFTYGRGTCPEQRIRNAQFLYHELPIRVAQRAVDLLTLPHGLSQAEPIRQVARIYLEYICQLQTAVPFPTTMQEEEQFTNLLQGFILDRTSIPTSIARGVRVWRAQFPDQAAAHKDEMELALYRFFTARVGLRFLTEHHVLSSGRREQAAALRQVTNLFPPCDEDDFLGCIQTNCNVVKEVTKVAEWVRRQTVEYYSSGLADDTSDGNALCPPIEIVDCNPDQQLQDASYFTYVPHHLHYMMAELLKNSVRATIRHHHSDVSDGEDANAALPRIRVIIAKGEEDVTIKICDKGGGIPRSRMQTIWKFDHTTAQVPPAATTPVATTSTHRRQQELDDSDFFGYHNNLAANAEKQLRQQAQQSTRKQRTSSVSSSSTTTITPPPARMQGFGLPLARIYARYFGGELTLKSTEGYGLDAYLYLPRLGDACENLPLRVRDSPGAGDSMPTTTTTTTTRSSSSRNHK